MSADRTETEAEAEAEAEAVTEMETEAEAVMGMEARCARAKVHTRLGHAHMRSSTYVCLDDVSARLS